MRELVARAGFVPASDGFLRSSVLVKGIWWMPWRQEARKDVARCEKPGGEASAL